jgi:DNA-binding response OmpR family regulator
VPKTILIVEDDAQSQQTMCAYLQRKGYRAACACAAREAAAKLAELSPDMAIVDVLTPRVGGADFVRHVRARGEGAKIPIVVMTAISASVRFEREASDKWGADDCITKPFDLPDLCARVLRHIGSGDETIAAAADKPEHVEHGVLEDHSYGRLLRQCLDERLSGALEIKASEADISLFFRDGRPVGARSNYIPAVSLTKVLVAQGAISEAQVEEARRHAQKEGVLLGEALVELGRLTALVLARALTEQARQKAMLPFAYEKGRYSLRRGPVVGERLQTIASPLPQLALDGVTQHVRYERLRRSFLGKEKRVFVHDPASAAALQDFTLSPEEMEFVRAAAPGMTVSEALAAKRLPPQRLFQVLYALVVMGAFRFKKQDRETPIASA